MHRPFVAAVLLIATLAACQPEGTGEPGTPEATAAAETAAIPDTIPEPADAVAAAAAQASGEAEDSGCGADRLGRWLNVLPTRTVKDEIADRYYTQGDPITMDFSPARLNVEVGEDGRIKLFRCG